MSLMPLLLSLKVSFVAIILSFAIGVPLAWLLAKKEFPGKDLLAALIIIPMVLPPTVIGYYLLLLVGRSSLLGRAWEAIMGSTLVFTWHAAVLASFAVSLPVVVWVGRAAFESVDQMYEDAARVLGKCELTVFFTITFPLAWKGLLAGTGLGFARALGEFGATVMVAGNIPGKTQTMPVAIYDAVQSGKLEMGFGMSLLVTLVTLGIVFVLVRYGGSAVDRRPR